MAAARQPGGDARRRPIPTPRSCTTGRSPATCSRPRALIVGDAMPPSSTVAPSTITATGYTLAVVRARCDDVAPRAAHPDARRRRRRARSLGRGPRTRELGLADPIVEYRLTLQRNDAHAAAHAATSPATTRDDVLDRRLLPADAEPSARRRQQPEQQRVLVLRRGRDALLEIGERAHRGLGEHAAVVAAARRIGDRARGT